MENMIAATKTVLNNYAKFEGRSGRPEYWWWMLSYFIAYIVVTFIGGATGAGNFLVGLLVLGVIVPTIAVSIRRFHDIGKPAIWAIAMVIPLVNLVVALVFLTKPSVGANEHGEGPQPLMS